MDFTNALRIISHNVETRTKDPVKFLIPQENIEEDIKESLKKYYDLMKRTENANTNSNQTLSTLLIENFDLEQIWQQLDLHNTLKTNHIDDYVSTLPDSTISFFGEVEEENENRAISDDENISDVDYDDGADLDLNSDDTDDSDTCIDNEIIENDYDSDDDIMKPSAVIKQSSEQSSIVDDEFFKLSEMERFLLVEEKEENVKKSDSDLIDYFADLSPDEKLENENGPKYADFFEVPSNSRSNKNKKTVRFNFDDDTEEDQSDKMEDIHENENNHDIGKPKSNFEERQDRIKTHVKKLEDEIMSEKPWQLKGEITAKKRPQNSLLEEVVEFDLSTRPAPVMTEEVMVKLEDIILRRIKDKVWDDVDRKIKPVDTPYEFKKKLILNQEKSKLSLAEIYEKEYIKQREEKNPENKKVAEEELKEHKQIRQLVDMLFRKLDALSNYHFTPMPIAPRLEIINNMPAIAMEEAAPVSVADATLLAPEEIQAKQKGELTAKEERTKTDMKRDRRKKKVRQKSKKKEVETREQLMKKLNVGMGNKYSKDKLRKELDQLTKHDKVSKLEEDTNNNSSLKSSKAFFSTLQDQLSDSSKRKKSYSNVLSINKKKRK